MLKKLLIIPIITLLTYPVLSLDCGTNDMKLVLTDETNQIPFDTLSTPVVKSLCLDSEEMKNFERQDTGTHCWCRITSFGDNPVSAKWHHVKHYNKNKFNEEKYRNKKNITEAEIQQKKNETHKQNIKDCTDNCQTNCESRLSTQKQNITGYYICDNAQYKLSNAQCVIDTKIIDTEYVNVFDDFAEILTKRMQHIVFSRDTNQSPEIRYISEFEEKPLYMKIQNNKIYLGREWFSMEDCIAK